MLLCLLINLLIAREKSFYTAIAAIICMQPTTSKSYQVGRGRIIGTVLGAAVGFIVLELVAFMSFYEQWGYILVVPVSIAVIIYLFNVLGQTDGLVIACVVFSSIALDFDRQIGDTIWYVVNRVVETGVGVSVAMLVNHFFFPRKETAPPPEEPAN